MRNNPQLHHALAGRLAVPQSLKEREVSPLQQERDGDKDGLSPKYLRGRGCRARLGRDVHATGEQDEEEDQYGGCEPLQQVVKQQSQSAAQEARERKLQPDQLRRVDAKLLLILAQATSLSGGAHEA